MCTDFDWFPQQTATANKNLAGQVVAAAANKHVRWGLRRRTRDKVLV